MHVFDCFFSDEMSLEDDLSRRYTSVHDVSPSMFISRVRTSRSVNKFVFGTGLTLEELDKVMSILTLVNGLMLTIPYNLFQCLGQSFRELFSGSITSLIVFFPFSYRSTIF